MATLEQLQNALIKADAAGNASDAKVFADEIRRLRSATSKEAQAADMVRLADPVAGMSTGEKMLAGVGKAFSDIGTGAGQLVNQGLDIVAPRQQTLSGLVTGKGPVSRVEEGRAEVAEQRRLDAPLMSTGAGTVGNIAGNVALLAPTALIPGAGTIAGAGAIGAATGLLQPTVSAGETALNVGLGGLGGAAGQYVANKLPGLAQRFLQSRQQHAAEEAAAGAQKFAAAQQAQALGYKIPPADLRPGMATEALSGLSGKIKTAQVASQRNQAVTDNLVRQSLGIPKDSPLDIPTLDAIRKQAGQAYEAIATTGTVTPSKAYQDALDAAVSPFVSQSKSFPGRSVNPVVSDIQALKTGQFDAADAVETIKILRSESTSKYRAGEDMVGKAYKKAAEALESALDDHLGKIGAPADSIKAYRTARQTIAKTYTVEKALNPQTGAIDASKLAGELKRGKPLSGELRQVAEFATAFPKASQALKEAPKSVSPLDFAVSGGAAMASQNPLALLALGARPVARELLLSGPMQRAAVNPAVSIPMSSRLAPLLANNRLAELLYTPAGVAGGLSLSNAMQQY